MSAAAKLPWTLPTAFEPMRFLSQWIVFQLHSPQGGKYQKSPIDHRTGAVPLKDHGGSEIWTSFDVASAAAARLGPLYGVGFYFTDADPFWFLDIDGCAILNEKGETVGWSQLATDLCARFPGAAMEVSSSYRGLHIIGSGVAPAHSCRNSAAHIEFYTAGRWVALTGINAQGSAATDHTGAIASLVAEYFQQSEAVAASDDLTAEPHQTWHGPADNDALIKIALRSKSAASMFNPRDAKPTFKQLWTADADKLAKVWPAEKPNEVYNASSADESLACHLAWWTGGHGERVLELMKLSALDRSKWDERDDYLRRTIAKACAWQKTYYNDGKGVTPGAAIPAAVSDSEISVADFYAYLPKHEYIFVPTRELWAGAGVDGTLPGVNGGKPTLWLDQARPIHQMTWAPGRSLVIPDVFVDNGGWVPKKGANTFNLYRPPLVLSGGDPAKAQPWIDLVRYIYPDDAEHLIKCFAHRRQRPAEKLNHAIVLGGSPGIGKDTILDPVKHAVGPWNFTEIKPSNLLDDFDGWKKSVMLRVSEARDMGDITRNALYEHTKTLLVTPPDVLRCNEKYLREHAVFNVIGVVITTNHKDGLYLPGDDRRHYVAWSERNKDRDYRPDFWADMYGWYEREGYAHVVAYLDSVDLTGFNPKAPPPLTLAFWNMVNASRPAEDSTMADLLDGLGNPPAVTVEQISQHAMKSHPEFCGWLKDPRNSRSIPTRFAAAEYVPLLNMDTKDKLWKVAGRRVSIYVRQQLSQAERLAAAIALSRPPIPPAST